MCRAARLAFPLALAMSLARPAAAQPRSAGSERLTLEWTAPAGCPGADALRAEVLRLLGGDVPDGAPVRASGETTLEDGRYRLTLRTQTADAPGERTLEGERCEELTDAAALIVALMIDPEAVAEEIEPEEIEPEEIEPEEPSEPEVLPEAPPLERARTELAAPTRPTGSRARVRDDPERRGEPPSRPEPDEAPRAILGAGGGVDVGTVPAPSALFFVEAGYGVPLIDGRLRVSVVLPQSGLRAPSAMAGAEVTSVSVDGRACVHPFEEARGLFACGGLLLGLSVAEGFGLAATETGVGTFVGAVVSLAGRWRPLDWLGLGLDATLVIPFNPLEFAVRGAAGDEVFLTQEPVSGRFGLAADAHF